MILLETSPSREPNLISSSLINGIPHTFHLKQYSEENNYFPFNNGVRVLIPTFLKTKSIYYFPDFTAKTLFLPTKTRFYSLNPILLFEIVNK